MRKPLLAQAQQAADEVKAIDRGTTGIVNVAATSSVLFSGLSTAIAAFKAENRNVEVIIHELSPKEQIERLEMHRVDACFLRFAPAEKNLIVTRAWREKVGLIVPLQHRLASRKTVRIAALKDEDFVFYRLPELSLRHPSTIPLCSGRFCSEHHSTGRRIIFRSEPCIRGPWHRIRARSDRPKKRRQRKVP